MVNDTHTRRRFPQLPFWISSDNEVSHIARRCQGWERKMRENSGVEPDGPRYIGLRPEGSRARVEFLWRGGSNHSPNQLEGSMYFGI